MLMLKSIRKETGILQKDLCEPLNVSVECISHWETGRTEPDLDALVKLADILDCSVDELLGRGMTTRAVASTRIAAATDEEKALLKAFRKMPQEVKTEFVKLAVATEKFVK